jgi:phosphoribosyl 1,2-cyclic phosphodiesterase
VRVTFHGVRGSTPSPGVDYVRYGGHTSCVGLAHDGSAPSLVLDAGTGLRHLSQTLAAEPFRGTLLLTHLHWDHTQGLPFFAAGNRHDADVAVLIPEQGDAVEVLSRMVSPPHFPILPTELLGRWRFNGLEPGVHDIEGFSVLAAEIPHKGGRTYGYRISDGHATIAYMPDHSPTSLGPGARGLGVCHQAALDLADGVDLLIHDAQYTAEELPDRLHYGHAAVDYAVELARASGAARLVLFHHEPGRTDEAVDAMLAGVVGSGCDAIAAAEGQMIDVPARWQPPAVERARIAER